MVKHLGAFPLPVEVVRYGSIQLFNKFNEKGYNPEFRKTATGENYLTDEKNNIIDLHLGEILDPSACRRLDPSYRCRGTWVVP